MVAAGKIIPAEMIVRMLRKIIYSGDGRTRFILSSFPDIIEQAKEFEKSCAAISAIIYASSDDAVVEIKNNNLTLFNIDALFQKEFRLKTVKQWQPETFQEFFQPQIEYHIIEGKSLTGKTFLANLLAKHLGYKLVDYKVIEEQVKKQLGTEDEPFEGDVPNDKVNEAVYQSIQRE